MINCKICNSNNVIKLFEKEWYHFYKCKKCKIVFQDPIVPAEVENYYKNKYYWEDRPLNQFINYFNFNKHSKILNLIKKFRETWKLLDIWAGYGYFVKIANDEWYNAYGIEPNEESVKIWKSNLWVDIVNWFFDNKFSQNNKYDIITNFHVIEHVMNPLEFIDDIYSSLNEKWLLVLETPNIRSINAIRMWEKWPYVLPNEHLYYFTFGNLIKILKDKWFKIQYKKRLGSFLYKKSSNVLNEIRSPKISLKMKIMKKIYDFLSEKILLWDHLLIIAEKI